MINIYRIMSVALGGILFVILMSIIMVITRNLKRMMLPEQGSSSLAAIPGSHGLKIGKNERVNVSWPVSFDNSHGKSPARTKVLSRGGAFIACQNPLPIKDKFHITIDVPSQEPLTLFAEVIWSNRNVPEENVITRGMEIRFINNSDPCQEYLSTAIASFLENNTNKTEAFT